MSLWVCSQCKDQGSALQSLGFRVYGFRNQGSEFRVSGSGFSDRVQGLGFRGQGLAGLAPRLSFERMGA